MALIIILGKLYIYYIFARVSAGKIILVDMEIIIINYPVGYNRDRPGKCGSRARYYYAGRIKIGQSTDRKATNIN